MNKLFGQKNLLRDCLGGVRKYTNEQKNTPKSVWLGIEILGFIILKIGTTINLRLVKYQCSTTLKLDRFPSLSKQQLEIVRS